LVEQLYGEAITKNFPNYREFWIKFIGDPKKDMPAPYGLDFTNAVKGLKIAEVKQNYEELCMAHYSLFCQLSGAHFQLALLKEVLKLPESKEKSFKHWEAFETSYMHLGSVFYQMYHVWGLVFLVRGEVGRVKDYRGILRFKPNAKQTLENLLNSKGQQTIIARKNKVDLDITALRDSIIHFSRSASAYLDGEFLIPMQNQQVVWSRQTSDEFYETSKKLDNDIKETEEILNDTHVYLVQQYEDFLTTNKIAVKK
jgi:hypothetical protein